MKIVSCQPDEKYFHWQLEVQFLNFIDLEINLHSYTVLLSYEKEPSIELLALMDKYPTVNWKIYQDTREIRFYQPSIRPHLLYKWFLDEAMNGSEITEPIFFIDSDIIFRQFPSFEKFTDKNTWYLSDTEHYTGSKYVESKGSGLLEDMCRLVGVQPDKVRESKAGGAQWFIQNTNYDFWRKVEEDSYTLYKYMQDSKNYFSLKWSEEIGKPVSEYHPIQMWTADMWAILWNGILQNNKIETPRELDFCWATCMKHRWQETKIMHNAGVLTHQSKDFFFKQDHIHGIDRDKLYFDTYSEKFCSRYYAEYIKRLMEKNN